jgi:hypothetical protein
MSYTERSIEKIVMRWLLNDKKHRIVVPNSTTLFRWEADIASVTRAGYAHEIEIKISKGDFARDKKKFWKHQCLTDCMTLVPRYTIPNYFWYCTPDCLEVDVPPYAGWLVVSPWGKSHFVEERKPAPRLHTVKIADKKLADTARLLSFRLLSEMTRGEA